MISTKGNKIFSKCLVDLQQLVKNGEKHVVSMRYKWYLRFKLLTVYPCLWNSDLKKYSERFMKTVNSSRNINT